MTALLALLGAVATQPATVGLAGNYGPQYLATVAALGARAASLDRRDLASPERLAGLDVLLVSHLHEGWPEGGEKAVADWVHQGGVLLTEIAAWPPAEVLACEARTSGWGPSLRIESTDSPLTAGLSEGRLLRYGAWAGGLRLPEASPVKVLARWDLSEAPTYDKAVDEGFRRCDVALAEVAAGEGRVFYSGAGLFIAAPQVVGPWLTAVLGKSRLPLAAIEDLWAADVSDAEAGPPRAGRKAVVFWDASCPRPAMPDVPASFFVDALRERLGLEASVVNADQLAAGAWLEPETRLLVLACGEAFPLDALDDLKRFLASGGAVLSVAGVPFSHLLARSEDGRVYDLGDDEAGRRGATYAVYSRLGFLAKVAALEQPAGAVTVNWPDSGLPAYWPLTGGTSALFLAGNGLNLRTLRPLVASVAGDGRVLGCPVSFSPVLGRFPRAGFLAVGFSGESHPLNPAAWPHASAALAAFARLLLEPPRATIADVWPVEPLYYPGEDVRVVVRVVAQREPADVRCGLRILERDTWTEVFSEERAGTARPGKPADLEFTWRAAKLGTWGYVALAQLEDASPPFDTDLASFLAFQPDFCARARPASVSPTGLPLRASSPEWFSGVNLYTADWRNVGVFFKQDNGPGSHPTVDAYDRDLALLRLFGGNTTRTHYFEMMLTPEILADDRAHAVRRLDAYNMLHAAHDAAAFYGPFTFAPGKYTLWQEYMKGKYGEAVLEADRYVTEDWLREMEAYYGALAGRCASLGARNLVWQLINEPEAYPPRGETDPTRRREGAEAVARWCRRMAAALEGAGYDQAGLGHSTAPMSYGWDPRGALSFLSSYDVHHYGAATVYRSLTSDPVWSVAFGLAYGRPAVLGEYGLPNAGQSRDVFLGHWLPSYEQALLCVLGEGSLGFLNFYLNCGMGSVDSPEWGMVRPDYTEKPAALAWKRWNWLTRRIPPDDLLPPDGALLFDPALRYDRPGVSGEVGRVFLDLLGEGLYTWILGPADLRALAEAGRLPSCVYAPEPWLADEGRQALQAAQAAGLRVTDDLEVLRSSLREASPARVLSPSAEAVYVRHLRGDRCLVAVVDASDEEVAVEVSGRRYELLLPKGRCALLVADARGAPEMLAACGPVRVDGKRLATGPEEGYALWAGRGRSLETDGARELWAEDQRAVAGPVALPDALRAREWRLEAAGDVPEGIEAWAGELLGAQGVRLSGTARARLVLCGPAWGQDAKAARPDGPLGRRDLSVRGSGSYQRLTLGAQWVEEPWTGLLLVDAPADAPVVYVYGLTDSALYAAVRRLASLRVLEDCLTAPFTPLSYVLPERGDG